MTTDNAFGDGALGSGVTSDGVKLFGATMGLVGLTGGFFALGAYLGHSLSPGWGLVFFFVAFALLLGMRFTVRASSSSSLGLLFAFGTALGVATGPTVAYYARSDPSAVWQAAGATALFMGGLGTAGYATRRDLSGLARFALWALVGLIVFGVVSVFVQIPDSAIVYSVLGLAIFAGLVIVDFQRLRRVVDVESAPLMAASIFLDALNVFLFFLKLFSRRD
jgi:FtsH-binding integral membrane protein